MAEGCGQNHFYSLETALAPSEVEGYTVRMKTKTKKERGASMKGFDLRNLNTKVRPQDDFFTYACGGWIKRNPIPSTKSRWGTFDVLREENLKKLHRIVKEMVAKKRATKGSSEQLIHDMYRAGMDMKTRNKLGIDPVGRFLKKIDAIKNADDLIDFIIYLQKTGFSLLWGMYVGQDDKDSEAYITFMGQGGLTLPDRDFYLMKDPRSVAIRDAFLKYVENIFVLAGESRSVAKENAKVILSFETSLARISMNKIDARNIDKIYHKKTLAQLAKLTPVVPWKRFLKEIGLSKAKAVVVMQPDFLRKATSLLKKTPIKTWKIYLRWNILDDAGGFLTKAFAKERFEFYGKVLSGRKKMEPHWKYVLGAIEGTLGEALGKEYVKRYFPDEAKKKINELVEHLFGAYRKRIGTLDWMSPETKKKALLKLSRIERKLGYPVKWKSYRGLVIKSDTYFENMIHAAQHEQKRIFRRLGKKVDRTEWLMTPQTVNAYYYPNMNDIAFPAGILQPPFFDPHADAAFNYGAIGSVIGHEITHGFDDQGAKFDGKGNFKNWWTKEDKKRFERKSKVLVAQFSAYKAGDLHVNGKLTLGENIADLGGLAIAFDAYMKHLQDNPNERKTIRGFTPEQRFFIGLTLCECTHERPEYLRTQVLTNPHSPGKFRVNGPVSNIPAFYQAFKVKKGNKLYRESKARAKIW